VGGWVGAGGSISKLLKALYYVVFEMQIVQQVNKKQFKSALTTEKANIHLQGCDSEMAVFDTAAT
jgi:hypothetical protein